jgi:hypothetical protein
MRSKLGVLAVPRFDLREHASPLLREYGILAVVFVVSRLALLAAGMHFELELRWMFLADPAALRDHLLQSVLYFHAYPPGMNLLTGMLLKIDEAHVGELARLVFACASFTLVASLYYIGRACDLSRAGAATLAIVFSLLPQTLFLENLYLYTTLSAALLCLASASFYRAVNQSSFGRWSVFFAVCVVLCWFRTTFHLVWFVAMVGLAVFATRRRGRRAVLWAAAAPAVLLLAVYLKNFALFRVFGTTSWGGANFEGVTTRQLPARERESLIAEGKLSPFANLSVFSEPDKYVRFFQGFDRSSYTHYPGSDELTRPTAKAANFNHWYFLEINQRRRADAAYYLQTHPGDYIDTVLYRTLPQFFFPTTHWHPNDKGDDSPHARHRQLLGWYENLYDEWVHGFPFKPVGLYVFLPLFLAWSIVRTWRLLRSQESSAWARGMLLAFCTLQILYVTVISVLFTYGESARYRYMVEAFIWLVVSACLSSLARSVTRGLSTLRGST